MMTNKKLLYNLIQRGKKNRVTNFFKLFSKEEIYSKLPKNEFFSIIKFEPSLHFLCVSFAIFYYELIKYFWQIFHDKKSLIICLFFSKAFWQIYVIRELLHAHGSAGKHIDFILVGSIYGSRLFSRNMHSTSTINQSHEVIYFSPYSYESTTARQLCTCSKS